MKTLNFIILLAVIAGCAPKAPTNSSVTNNYATNPITNGTTNNGGGTSTGGGGGGTSTDGGSSSTGSTACDGIASQTATKCYYKNIPTVQVSGDVPLNTLFWTSVNLPASISQNQFVTDARFNIRIIPRRADASQTSASGKACSPFTLENSKKLQVKLMLRKQGVGIGEVITLSANRDTPSPKGVFTVPGGTTQPYILEVTSVQSDTRCNWAGGTGAYCPFSSIPYNTLGPTECVAFDIQYSTDETYDLP